MRSMDCMAFCRTPHPSAKAFQRRVQADACPRLANRPKAIVIGPSLGMNAAQALERVCPVEAAEVPAYYSLREDAGNVRIYVRKP